MTSQERYRDIYETAKLVLQRYRDPPEDGRSLERDSRQETNRLLKISEFVESWLASRRNAQLLEIGLGFSFVTSALRKLYDRQKLTISAIEHPDVPLISRDDFKKHLVETGVTLTKADILTPPLPYEDSSFDIIVFSETIEHVPPTRVPALLKEFARLLKSAGVVIISTPNLAAWRYRWKLMRGKAIFDPAIPVDFAGGGVYAHIRLYTTNEVRYLLEYAGLKVIATTYINYGIDNKGAIQKLAARSISSLFPSLSPEFFIVAEKP